MTGVSTADPMRGLRRATYAAMLCIGLYAGGLGPALETFAKDLHVSLDTAGLLVSGIFAGSITTSTLVAARLHRFSQRRLAVTGAGLIAVGLAGLAVAPAWWTAILAAVFLGLGDGLAVSSAHALAARAGPDPALNISRINQAFAVGAMAGPAFSGVVLTVSDERWPIFLMIAVASAVTGGWLWRCAEPQALEGPRGAGAASAIPHGAVAWLMGALLFLYVGAEVGLGSWTTSYTREASDASLLGGALVTSAYWGALWLGRLASGRALSRGRTPGELLAAALVGGVVGSAVLAGGGSVFAIGALAAAFTGFCFGPIWASALAIGAANGRSNAPALLVTLGNAGGIVLPWLQGRILVDGGARAGIALTAVLCLAMLGVAAIARTRGGVAAGAMAVDIRE